MTQHNAIKLFEEKRVKGGAFNQSFGKINVIDKTNTIGI